MGFHMSVVTLGVRDVLAATRFYRDVLGCSVWGGSDEHIAFFSLGNIVLSLFPIADLAEDAGISVERLGTPGGMTLASNMATIEAVDAIFARLAAEGVDIVKAPTKASWGGYSGYFRDSEGYLWEIAYNPFFPLDAQGRVILPEQL